MAQYILEIENPQKENALINFLKQIEFVKIFPTHKTSENNALENFQSDLNLLANELEQGEFTSYKNKTIFLKDA